MSGYTTDADVLAAHVEVVGRTVVDVGCGGGDLVRWLRASGADPIGVECGTIMLATARAADPEHADTYVEAGGQDLPLGDETADVVTFLHSLHHVPVHDMATAIDEAWRVLRPGGVLWVAEPVAAGPGHEVARLIDDETEVRVAARRVLDEALDHRFVDRSRGRYRTQSVYADFAAYEQVMVGVDPGRAAAVERARDETEELFHRNGTVVAGGVAFDREVVFDRAVKGG